MFFAKHRIGSYKLNFMVVKTQLSTMWHSTPQHLLTGTHCLLFNSILVPKTLLSLTLVLHSLMVSHYSLPTLIRRMTHRNFLGMVSSIVDNELAGWDYGYVLEQQ